MHGSTVQRLIARDLFQFLPLHRQLLLLLRLLLQQLSASGGQS
jgi:hypothetical protein